MHVVSALFVLSGLCVGLTACVQRNTGPRYEEACFAETNVLEREKRGDAQAAGRDLVACLNRSYEEEAARTGQPVRHVVTFNGQPPAGGTRAQPAPASKTKQATPLTAIPTINTNANASSGYVAPAQPAPVQAQPAVTGNPMTGAAIAGDGKSCNRTMTGGTGYGCMPN